MEITNIETIPGKKITTHYGVVYGSTAHSRNAFKDIGVLFKNMFGGELKKLTRLLEETCQEAISRMIHRAYPGPQRCHGNYILSFDDGA